MNKTNKSILILGILLAGIISVGNFSFVQAEWTYAKSTYWHCDIGGPWGWKMQQATNCPSGYSSFVDSAQGCSASGGKCYKFDSGGRCGVEDECCYQLCRKETTPPVVPATTMRCSSDLECGTDVYTGSAYCFNDDVYQYYKVYSCQNNNNNNSSLTTNETVKNLTQGGGWSNSTYANPSDMLLFMIIIQNNSGQSLSNVNVRDVLSPNLIYNNQMVVSTCSNYTNGSNVCSGVFTNYSGDIISGLNLYSIGAGQTIAITYQAQVGPAQNFNYGTTTLTNSISVTGTGSGYNPVNNASVNVNKSQVLGATTISTGLTNNFWVDSFVLPLLATLIVIWMWRAGMFFRIEKWLGDRKKVRRGYYAEKELSSRVSKIHKYGA